MDDTLCMHAQYACTVSLMPPLSLYNRVKVSDQKKERKRGLAYLLPCPANFSSGSRQTKTFCAQKRKHGGGKKSGKARGLTEKFLPNQTREGTKLAAPSGAQNSLGARSSTGTPPPPSSSPPPQSSGRPRRSKKGQNLTRHFLFNTPSGSEIGTEIGGPDSHSPHRSSNRFCQNKTRKNIKSVVENRKIRQNRITAAAENQKFRLRSKSSTHRRKPRADR